MLVKGPISARLSASVGDPILSTEDVQDIVASLLVAGANITLTYDDPANTLTISGPSSYSDEQAQDAIASMLVAGTNITLSYNDPANTLTISSSGFNPSQLLLDPNDGLVTDGNGNALIDL